MRILLFIIYLSMIIGCADKRTAHEIRKVTSSMEAAWNSGNKAEVAAFYSDDAYLINPDGIRAQGRQEVNAYWAEFPAEPVNWKLSDFLITKSPEEILKLDQLREGKREMKLWTDLDILLPENPVFQYGQSELTYIRNGKSVTSTVEFIIIWKETSDGWRIFLDTYR